MRNRTLGLMIIITALTSVLASCDLVDMTGPGQPQVPDCSGVSISVVGYGEWIGAFNDTLAVGDSVSLLAFSRHAVQQTDYFGGTYWSCSSSDSPLTLGIAWSSDNVRVATVTGGTVRAVQPGSTVISVVWNGGGSAQTATLPLTVIARAP